MGQDEPIVVFIHGGPGLDSSYFHPFLSNIDHARTFFYDHQPIYGVDCEDRTPMDGYTRELQRVCSQFRAPVVLCGHSFGGAIVLDFCRRFSAGSVVGLILISWTYDLEVQSLFIRANDDQWTPQRMASDEAYKEFVLGNLSHYFSPSCLKIGRQILSKVNYRARLFNDVWFPMQSLDLKSTLADLTVPVLSLCGEDDRVVPASYSEIGERLVPNCEAKRVPHAGHFPFVERPGLCRAQISTFVRSLDRQRQAPSLQQQEGEEAI